MLIIIFNSKYLIMTLNNDNKNGRIKEGREREQYLALTGTIGKLTLMAGRLDLN